MQGNALSDEVRSRFSLQRFLLAVGSMFLFIHLSCGKAETIPPLIDSGLTIEPAHMKLGRVTFGEKTTGVFQIKNTSDEPKQITRIGPATCSCTTLVLSMPERSDFSPREIRGHELDLVLQPGELAELEVEFDTSRNRRPISRRTDAFAIAVAGAHGILLQYSVDVWTPFWLEPWSQDLGRVGARSRPSGFASVKAHDEQGFELIVPESVDGWEVVVNAIEGTDVASYTINFKAPEELPLGPFAVEIPVRTDLMGSPTLKLRVYGVAVPDVDWAPRKVVLRPDSNGQASQTVELSSRSKDAKVHLKIAAMTGLPEGVLEINWEAVQEGSAYRIFLDVTNPPTERLEGELLLVVESDDTPQIHIPVVVLPRP